MKEAKNLQPQSIEELKQLVVHYKSQAHYYKDLSGYLIDLDIERPVKTHTPTFEELSANVPERHKSWIDKEDLNEDLLDSDIKLYRKNGILIKDDLIEHELLDEYWRDRLAVEDSEFSVWGGSYMELASMRALALHPKVLKIVESIIGHPPALFLSLSGIKTTSRNWHQDFYLKPGYENASYVAIWVALEDITEDMGPFEYVPKSHKQPCIRREKTWEFLPKDQRDHPGWGRFSQGFVSEAIENKMVAENMRSETFLAKKGQILFWHPLLFHRGSSASAPEKIRPGVIFHYNAAGVLKRTGKKLAKEYGGQYVDRNDKAITLKKRFS